MDAFFERLGLMELTETTVIVRLMLAVICSGILGLERTRKRRPAGLRTYMLVCIGAAIVMMTAQFALRYYPDADLGRMPAQVVSGIGFLGAGTIMVTRYYRVKGLTTAAGLWVAACMGLAIGMGFYFGAIITCLILLMVMTFVDRFETYFTKRLHRVHLYLIFQEVTDFRPFRERMAAESIEISDVETSKSDCRNGVGVFCILKFPSRRTYADVIAFVESCPGVLFTEEIED